MTYVQRDSASPTRTTSPFSQTWGRVTLTPVCWDTPSSADGTKSFMLPSSSLSKALCVISYFSKTADEVPLRRVHRLVCFLLPVASRLTSLLCSLCLCMCVCVCLSLPVTHTDWDLPTFYNSDPPPTTYCTGYQTPTRTHTLALSTVGQLGKKSGNQPWCANRTVNVKGLSDSSSCSLQDPNVWPVVKDAKWNVLHMG